MVDNCQGAGGLGGGVELMNKKREREKSCTGATVCDCQGAGDREIWRWV